MTAAGFSFTKGETMTETDDVWGRAVEAAAEAWVTPEVWNGFGIGGRVEHRPIWREAAHQALAAALPVLLADLADRIEAERTCSACADFYRGKRTPKHDLELGCAPDCPCQHVHRPTEGTRDGALTVAADLVRSFASEVSR